MSDPSIDYSIALTFNIIAAMDNCYGISKNGDIPWHIKEDINRFRDITTGSDNTKINIVIMGRKTWEAVPDTLLKNRINIVISSTISNIYPPVNGLVFTDSLSGAFDLIKIMNDIGDIFVIGGSQLYKEALSKKWIRYCDRMYLTTINFNYMCDNKFPYQDCSNKYLFPINTEWCVINDTSMNVSGKLDYKNVIYKNKEMMNDTEFQQAFNHSLDESDEFKKQFKEAGF
jgi:dihydrofolate reductase